ncbi:MAG: hypothetical protein WBW32_05945 [Luteibacter sp.]
MDVTLKKVTLKKEHKHAGVKYPAGESIEVNEADAQWLSDNGVIDKLPAGKGSSSSNGGTAA